MGSIFTTLRRTIALFGLQERWKLAGVSLAVLVMAFIEVVGVASIMPFMALVANPGLVERNRWMRGLFETGGFESTHSFLLFVGVAVLVVITLSNAFTAFTTWLMLDFAWQKHHSLARQLLGRYLDEPYTYYLDHNTSGLSKNILLEISNVVQGAIIPGLQAASRAVVAVCLVALLFAVDVMLATTLVVVLGGAYVAIFVALRGKQARLGRARLDTSGAMYKIASEAFGGIKDVKVLDRAQEFLSRFSRQSEQYSRYQAADAMIGQLPRYALESIAFGGILVIVLYLLALRRDIDQIIPVVSLYALAGYRLMPALQQVFHGLTRLNFNGPVVEEVYRDLRVGEEPARATGRGAGAIPEQVERIALRRVYFRYPQAEGWTLQDVNIDVKRNQVVGLVGATGSGKTTIVDIILGLLTPARGRLVVNDTEVTEANVSAWKAKIGYVPQHIFLSDDSIARNIAFGLPDETIDMAAVERAARIANIHQFITGLPRGYQTEVGERGVRLSGGERQRIGIARALYHDPEIIILDEATSALDGATESTVMEAIHDLAHRKTLIVIAHRLTTVQDCDLIYMVHKGEIAAQGDYRALVASSGEFRRMAKTYGA